MTMRRNSKKTRAYGVPTIDLSDKDKSNLSQQIVKACEEFGIFKVVNHGVSDKTLSAIETEAQNFFAKPVEEKSRCRRGGPNNGPFGYGCNNIGFNGDKGQLEYILLEANQDSMARRLSKLNFSGGEAVREYVEAVRDVACEVLELAAEGLAVTTNKHVFSNLLRDSESDSCFRINHYPEYSHAAHNQTPFIGFGEHSDPQILTVLRSNDVGGLQICPEDELWVPVQSDPDNLFVMVGDTFEALTNGRFKSVRHRVVNSSSSLSLSKPRMSMMFFGAPPLNAVISPPPFPTSHGRLLYKAFTWGEYKQAVYSLRLAHNRLSLFKNYDFDGDDDDDDCMSSYSAK